MRNLIAFLAAATVVACSGTPQNLEIDSTAPAEGVGGMVSSAHPLATEAGLETLKRGGNAFDAAVTIASVLNVVEPMMSGLGGYGTILVYDAEGGQALYLDASGKIPIGVDPEAYRPPTPDHMENRRNAKAVSTPGAVNAWEAMSKRFGRLAWNDLLEPAIEIADNGFVLDERAAWSIDDSWAEFPENARAFYGKGGMPLEAGDPLVQKDLAASLRMVASDGAAAIYGGSIGEAIDSAMAEAGGFLAVDDLVNDRAEWWTPIRISYRGHEVVTPSAPAGAFPMLVRLGMMGLAEPQKLGHNSLAYCTFEPPGNPMDAHPGRRKLSSDAPSFVLRDGRPWIAVGTPGGHTITQAVAQMILNAVEFGMDIQQAIDAPRIAFVEPTSLVVDEGIDEAIRERLAALGHEIVVQPIGNAHGLAIEYDDEGMPVRFFGAAVHRGTGLAKGY
jgi:gamma-glutamyltranspeptidase